MTLSASRPHARSALPTALLGAVLGAGGGVGCSVATGSDDGPTTIPDARRVAFWGPDTSRTITVGRQIELGPTSTLVVFGVPAEEAGLPELGNGERRLGFSFSGCQEEPPDLVSDDGRPALQLKANNVDCGQAEDYVVVFDLPADQLTGD